MIGWKGTRTVRGFCGGRARCGGHGRGGWARQWARGAVRVRVRCGGRRRREEGEQTEQQDRVHVDGGGGAGHVGSLVCFGLTNGDGELEGREGGGMRRSEGEQGCGCEIQVGWGADERGGARIAVCREGMDLFCTVKCRRGGGAEGGRVEGTAKLNGTSQEHGGGG